MVEVDGLMQVVTSIMLDEMGDVTSRLRKLEK